MKHMDRLDTYIAGFFTSSLAGMGGLWAWLLNSDFIGQIVVALVVGGVGGITSLTGIYLKHKLELKKELLMKALDKGVITAEEVKKLL